MQKIDTKFNVVWTFILCFVFGLDYLLFSYEPSIRDSSKVIIDKVESPLLALVVVISLSIFIVFVVAKLFMEIWNRLITDIFKLRCIGFVESYALCFLLVGIIGVSGFF